MRPPTPLALASGLLVTVLLAACSGSAATVAPKRPPAGGSTAGATVTATNPATATAPPAARSAVSRTLGAVTFNDSGTADTTGKGELALSLADYSFQPTFVQGTPGAKITVQVANTSETTHNFSVEAQKIDEDVPSKGKVSIDITIPQSGAVLFYCKFHSGSGMNGEVLAGNSSPQAVPKPSNVSAATDYNY